MGSPTSWVDFMPVPTASLGRPSLFMRESVRNEVYASFTHL